MQRRSNLTVGSIVEDREGTSPRGVVVNYPPIPATDWYVQGRGTLAEDNPNYPADDRTAIAIYESALEEYYPEYAGCEGIPIAQLNTDDAPYYAFPESRLEPVGDLEPPTIPLASIDPSPYHARNFTAAENRDYIDEIAQRGHPDPVPTVRPTVDGGYEILNGHKRIWASHVAGLEAIPVSILPLDHYRAAKYWAQRHLPGYEPRQQREALERLHDRYNGLQVEQIAGDWVADTAEDSIRTACTDGGTHE